MRAVFRACATLLVLFVSARDTQPYALNLTEESEYHTDYDEDMVLSDFDLSNASSEHEQTEEEDENTEETADTADTVRRTLNRAWYVMSGVFGSLTASYFTQDEEIRMARRRRRHRNANQTSSKAH